MEQAFSKSSRVAIVGGGVGGLTLANALQQQGFENVTVFEQWATVKARGGHISCRPADQGGALGVLDRLGLRKEVEAVAQRTHWTILQMFNARQNVRVENYFLGPRIMREALQQILLGGVKPETLRFGMCLRDICEHSDGVELRFDGGDAERFDLVVAADGINSVVAPRLFPHESSKAFSGFVCYVCVAQGEFVPDGTFFEQHVDCGDHGFCIRSTSGFGFDGRWDLAAFVVRSDTPVPNSWDSEGTKGHVRPFLAAMEARGCRPQWLADLVESSQRVWRWGIYEHAPKRTWISPSGRAVLLGDAAHAMAPFMGLGAQAAMLDAEALAEELARGQPLAESLRAYEGRRKGPCEEIVSRANYEGRAITSFGVAARYLQSARVLMHRVQVGLVQSPRPLLRGVGGLLHRALVLGHLGLEQLSFFFGPQRRLKAE